SKALAAEDAYQVVDEIVTGLFIRLHEMLYTKISVEHFPITIGAFSKLLRTAASKQSLLLLGPSLSDLLAPRTPTTPQTHNGNLASSRNATSLLEQSRSFWFQVGIINVSILHQKHKIAPLDTAGTRRQTDENADSELTTDDPGEETYNKERAEDEDEQVDELGTQLWAVVMCLLEAAVSTQIGWVQQVQEAQAQQGQDVRTLDRATSKDGDEETEIDDVRDEEESRVTTSKATMVVEGSSIELAPSIFYIEMSLVWMCEWLKGKGKGKGKQGGGKWLEYLGQKYARVWSSLAVMSNLILSRLRDVNEFSDGSMTRKDTDSDVTESGSKREQVQGSDDRPRSFMWPALPEDWELRGFGPFKSYVHTIKFTFQSEHRRNSKSQLHSHKQTDLPGGLVSLCQALSIPATDPFKSLISGDQEVVTFDDLRRTVVDRHGGRIWLGGDAESEEGRRKGTSKKDEEEAEETRTG
ncbi:hypothetical protein HK102_009224, partial [Quaeritorhiza haematococci]